MLLLPTKEISLYPTPPSVETPPSGEISLEKENYYFRKYEKLQEIDRQRYLLYLQKLARAETEEEKEKCKAEALAHQNSVEVLHERVTRALKFNKKKGYTPTSMGKGTQETTPKENEYLELTSNMETPQVLEKTRQKLEDIINQEETMELQKEMDNQIKQNLESMGMIACETQRRSSGIGNQIPVKTRQPTPEVKSPLPQREGIEKVKVRPIGENTIPVKYSKELGRHGGIERPTSTEARESQNKALQAAKDFFNGGKSSLGSGGMETPVGEPQRDLD